MDRYVDTSYRAHRENGDVVLVFEDEAAAMTWEVEVGVLYSLFADDVYCCGGYMNALVFWEEED